MNRTNNSYKKDVACNTCGTPNLHWEQDVAGWRLFSPEGVIHNCYAAKNEKNKLQPIDFSVPVDLPFGTLLS